MNIRTSRYLNTPWLYLIALVLGLLQAMVFDFAFDSSLVVLAPVFSVLSISGFLWILNNLTPKKALLFGYIFGLGVFAWGLNWVYISMARFGGSSVFFAILANIAVISYLALYWLAIAYCITKLGKTTNQRLLLAAPVIALLEWVRSVFLLGFSWLSIGYGWIDTPISTFAALGGVWLVSFLVVLMCSVALLSIKRLQKLLLFIGLIALLAIFYPSFNPDTAEKKATVALLQGNMPVITEYNHKHMQANMEVYSQLTDATLASGKSPEVIIWPESAIPYFHNEISVFRANLLSKQQERHFDFISGVPYVDMRQRKFYNAILLQKAQSQSEQYYFKHHLLPFGEYLPFRSVFDFFEEYVSIPMSDFSRGREIQPSFLAAGLKFSPSICFEAAFGDEIRQSAAHADILLNISNDAWFGRSKAQAQHLNIARMRAVENQKTLIRATNNGITAIISPTGAVIQSLPAFKKGWLTATVSGYETTTRYAQWGDSPWVILFILLIILIGLFPIFFSRKKAVKSSKII